MTEIIICFVFIFIIAILIVVYSEKKKGVPEKKIEPAKTVLSKIKIEPTKTTKPLKDLGESLYFWVGWTKYSKKRQMFKRMYKGLGISNRKFKKFVIRARREGVQIEELLNR